MSAVILTSLGSMGVMANLALIVIILVKRPLRRWLLSMVQVFPNCVYQGGARG